MDAKFASITQVHLIYSSLTCIGTFLNLHYLSCTLVVVACFYPYFLPYSGCMVIIDLHQIAPTHTPDFVNQDICFIK